MDYLSYLNKKLAAQDVQIESIFSAEAEYKKDKDIDALIKFWEQIWSSGGLIFNGSRWTFRIVDLYIKVKRYDDAWRILNIIIATKPQYLEKARLYQIRVLKKENKNYDYIQRLLDEEAELLRLNH